MRRILSATPVLRVTAPLLLAAACGSAIGDAGELRARHAQLRDALVASDFGHPLHIASHEARDALAGDIHAVLDHPFATVREALARPAAWCDILILPFNTKDCRERPQAGGTELVVRVGRKWDQPLDKTYRLAFAWRTVAARSDHLELQLQAPEGPVGTRDYRITVAAIPLEDGRRTFLRLHYAYGYGMAGRLAMQAYLATAGADKVGFSQEGRDAAGRPAYVGGVRGAVERNAMRYYLAIDAHLDALQAPPAQRDERRIQGWFSAVERWPRQLHEMDRATYVAMKRREIARQRGGEPD